MRSTEHLRVQPSVAGVQSWTVDLLDASGNGATEKTVVTYACGETRLSGLSAETSNQGRTVDDTFKIQKATAEPEAGWRVGQRVVLDAIGASGTVLHYAGGVIRPDTLIIGGRPVATVVVHETLTGTGRVAGISYQSKGTSDQWYAAGLSFPVKSAFDAYARAGTSETTVDYTMTLASTTPSPT
jgi:hypothetical protein